MTFAEWWRKHYIAMSGPPTWLLVRDACQLAMREGQSAMRERCAEEFNRLWAAGTPFHEIADALRALEVE